MSWEKSKDDLREEFSRQVNKRKPTAKWCKGKEGREHTPELVINHNYVEPVQLPDTEIKAKFACRWYPIYYSYMRRDEGPKEWRYSCRHSYRCTACGKYTEYYLKNIEECPDFHPKPE